MILSARDSTLFYDLWKPLLQYANQRTKMFPDINFKKEKEIFAEYGCEMADWIWDHTDIIDDYLKEHPGMKAESKDILISWKRCVHGRWIIERHLKSGSVFLGKSPYAFMVQGIVSSFEEMVGMYGTPLFIEATLIPFRDQIITDGFVKAMPIQIGPNMKNSFKDEYLAAKKEGNVITSLTEEAYRRICENDKKREEDKPRGNVVQLPLNREQPDEDVYDDDDYYDEDDDFYPDDLPEENHGYMMMFQKDLAASNLTSQTINHHLENADLFLNEYLWGWEEEHMEEGIARIDSFFMDYFIDEWPWASQTSIRQTAASIKKFYRSMLNHGKVTEKEYQQVDNTIHCRKETWLEELRRRSEEDDDF